MSRTWVFQNAAQVRKHGAEKASWYAGWLDTDGKRKGKSMGPGARGKKAAELLAEKIAGELREGTYQRKGERVTWAEFRAEYDKTVLTTMEAATARLTRDALASFERIMRPKLMRAIKTAAIDRYIATRRTERGQKKGSIISAATMNKELRHLRSAIQKSVEWEMLAEMPKFHMLRELQDLPTFVTDEHFTAIYASCDVATMPELPNVSPADWWRALLIHAFMTGWRINEILSLPRSDVDLEAGVVILRAKNTKGRRADRVNLHPIVVEHLARIAAFDDLMFRWPHAERTLYTEFLRIQQAAGINLPCTEDHEHTPYCHVYSFHDLRRAFATANEGNVTPKELQKLMRHASYTTTERYINMAKNMKSTVDKLHVPSLENKKKAT